MTTEMRPTNPATEKQKAFIRKLISQGKSFASGFFVGDTWHQPRLCVEALSKWQAMDIINTMLASKVNPANQVIEVGA